MGKHITRISVEHESVKATIELGDCPEIADMIAAFRGLLIAITFHPDIVAEFMPLED